MGEVYRAHDTKLDRDVAIKVLPAEFAASHDRVARFEREARTLASLNHPNIGAIHGLEDSGGTKALVLELVEGPTLADRIGQGAVPLDQALSIARQITDALEAAHETGVIHRDLKPANIKLRPDGTVKVLDFGLAKAYEAAGSRDQTLSPTLTSPAQTMQGVILGTAAYMSPEQAGGEEVDQRSDIWAFGVVLHEMLTGRRLFDGSSVAHVLARVLERELDFAALPAATPPSIRRLLRRCLERDRRKRLHHIADARVEIDEALSGTPGEAATTLAAGASGRGIGTFAWPVGALVVGAVISGAAVWSMTRPEPPMLAQFEITTPEQARPGSPIMDDVAISPDGQVIVYASGTAPGGTGLYLRQVDQLAVTALRGAEIAATNPFFSPDARQVGFVDVPARALKAVSVLGGPASTLASLSDTGAPLGADWGPDGSVVIGSPGGLWMVPATGGSPERLTTRDQSSELAHAWPDVLPDGNGVLFTSVTGTTDSSVIAVLSLESGEITQLVSGGSHPRYVPPGFIVYGSGGSLRAVRFDPDRLTVRSGPVPVLEGVATENQGAGVMFALADNGSLVYRTGASASGQSTLVWVDRDGIEEPFGLAPRDYFQVFVSPDGSRVAAAMGGQAGGGGLWVTDIDRPVLTPIPTGEITPFGQLWTTDSRRLVFGTVRTTPAGVFRALADGTGQVERLTTVEDSAWVSVEGRTPDGGAVVFTHPAQGGTRIGMLAMGEGGGEREWQPLIERAGGASMLSVAPQGDWIAYQSLATGQYGVYIERFPESGDRRQISDERGGWARLWSVDGSELYYRRLGDGAMMAVSIQTSPTVTIEPPRVLFESQGYIPLGTPAPGQGAARQWDLGPEVAS